MLKRTLQFWLWAPFWLVTRPVFFGIVILATILWHPHAFGMVIVSGVVVGGIALPIEARLRPMNYGGKTRLPKRGKPMAWARAQLAVKGKPARVSLAAIHRRLSPELRTMLTAPVNRQPEAVLHDSRLAQSQAAA